MTENISLSEELKGLISSKKYEEAKDYIYKNFSSDKKPFRNIEFIEDHLTDELKASTSVELKLGRKSHLFWFAVMTILTGIHLYLWVSPEQSGYPWLLLFWIPGMLIFGMFLLDRKAKLIIDNDAITIQHKEQSRIELDSILAGYVHSVTRHNRSIFSRPDYYLTLISKDSINSTHVNISGLELNGWKIGAFLNLKMSKN